MRRPSFADLLNVSRQLAPRLAPAAKALLLSCTLGALVGLSACDRAPPRPAPHVSLHVHADGALELDHQRVSAAQLDAALRERVQQEPGLLVEVHASPQADITQLKALTATIEAAHARVAFNAEQPASVPSDAQWRSGFSW